MKKIYLLSIVCSLYFTTAATIRNVPSVYTTIQTALDSCAAGDTVLVQPGTYFENIVWPDIANIKLFSAGDSSNTIINGGSLNTVIYLDQNNMSVTIDSNTVIKGFKITGGGNNIPFAYGCGIWMLGCSPKLEEISVTGNHTNDNWGSGAGIYAEFSNMILSNSSVAYNQIDTSTGANGAGIFCSGGNTVLNNVNINDNLGISDGLGCRGGGIFFIECSSIILNNVSVYNNTMTGGSSPEGGGMYFTNDTIVQLNNVSVYNNALGDGGGSGGGIYLSCDSLALFNNVFIYNNTMGDNGSFYTGGGMVIGAPHVSLENVSITNNTMGNGGSFYTGAGLLLGADTAYLKNVLIASNVSGQNISFQMQGGAIKLGAGTNLNMINCTLADNKTLSSNNVAGTGIFYSGTSNIIASNCLFWNQNQGTEIVAAGGTTGTTTITYSDIRGGYVGTGNIDTLPGFVSATDFHLTPGSPCLNVGTLPGAPPFDLDNMPRPAPAGTNPDMGCYELNQPSSVDETNGENNLFEISPNPTKEFLVISLSRFNRGSPLNRKENLEITITDVQGKKVFHTQSSINNRQSTISLKGFSKGIYFVEINDGREKTVKKFLKN